MTTQFQTLFVVTIVHAYYRENCADVAFVIPADTAQRLRNGKLLAREIEGKLYVLFEADEHGAVLMAIPGQTLRIGLRLLNPFFDNVTEPDPTFALSKRLYRNAAALDALDQPSRVQLVGPVFSHVLIDGARPVTLTLKNNAGLTLRTDEVTAANDRPEVSYDLTGLAPGTYSIEEAYPAGITKTSYYSDPELVRAGVFGVLEVEIGSGFYSSPADFQITFQARKETLKYYVVARNYNDDFEKLSVVDANDVPSPIAFTKVASSAFDSQSDLSPVLLTNGSGRVVLFKATNITRTEKARRKIQLKKNGDVLIEHLPQPRADQPNADLVIPISKP
jgi:hypothetical protein